MIELFVAALLGAWAAELAELSVVLLSSRAELTSGWEARMGATWLAPTLLAAAVPSALVGAALFAALERQGPGPRRALAGAAGAAAATVAALVTTGRHFAQTGQRAIAVAIVAGAAALGVHASHAAVGGWVRNRPRAFAFAAFGVAALVEAVNRFVLVRLYPPFHVSLAAAALAVAAAGACALTRAGLRPSRPLAKAALAGAVLLVPALAVPLAEPAARRLAGFDNVRLLLVERGPILGQAVEIAARLAPPPPIDASAACLLDPNRCGTEKSAVPVGAGPSFAGRDLVIVSIDALRADHVGAYGYLRPTTPRIDALAKEGVLFEHAYCPTPHTSYSVTSLMTGKYMRPLLLQGAGQDSDTLATYLRTYGYRTAAFYPPAVFFIDQGRFEAFEKTHFGFEYAKIEFMEGEGRVEQVARYLSAARADQRLLLWVHLFGPHEPYEAHPEHPFGDRDVDRYDSEIAAADGTTGAIVDLVRKARPAAVIVVTADHGEEFGDHGGRYHGTSVYEEQVRVPLLIDAPGLLAPRRIGEVVQTIDLLPTLLAALSIPASPRIRGRDLGPLLSSQRPEGPGMAFAETEEDALLAEGSARLVCARKLGACRLYDIARDPHETTDIAGSDPDRAAKMRAELSALGASHGRFELAGLRRESGRGWPAPILRALAGDADAAPDLAPLLDDADPEIREKSAELLFKLRRPESAPALRLALARDEDVTVRRWCALALTRLGEGAPLALDVFQDSDLSWRRRAALALSDAGDGRGQAVLVDWWQHGGADDYEQALDLLSAFAKIRAKDAVWVLVHSLGNVRLRPRIASTLAAIGDPAARGPLVAALADERYQTARVAITDALVALGAEEELARPLVRFLGVPDPIPGGLGYAERAGVLELVGGPGSKDLRALQHQSDVGVLVHLVVPKTGNGTGVRVIVRARAAKTPGEVRVGRRLEPLQFDAKGNVVNQRQVPKIHDRDFVRLDVPATDSPVEVAATLPDSLGVRPGRAVELVVFAERHVTVEALAVVPLADELPPPPPEPWQHPVANGADP